MYVTIGGLRPLGKEAVWVLFGGCNWKCPYCYEKDILDKEGCKKSKKCSVLSIRELVGALLQAKPKLVRIGGGEPTEQPRELERLCMYLKGQGVSVQLHTNGSHPEVVGDLLTKKLVDMISIDVKAPLDNERLYKKMTGGFGNPQPVRESIDIARDKAGYFELVYPVVPGENDKKKYVTAIAKDVYYCNSFVVHGFDKRRPIVSEAWYRRKQVPKHEDLKKLAVAARDAFTNVDSVRVISHEGEEEI
ncbi:MAG: radical SAM protein [Candidatus Diapherotrites archaeon]|nr:radical SAM protein [Candidatus Diapherotrites archaeon]